MSIYTTVAIDKSKAYVTAHFNCSVCGLRISLDDQKTGKEEIISQEITKEWRYS